MIANASFLDARNLLLETRADYEAARRGFAWPHATHFNWALDYFDVMAAGNDRQALWIVEESGEESRLSFAALALRSNQAPHDSQRASSIVVSRPAMIFVSSPRPPTPQTKRHWISSHARTHRVHRMHLLRSTHTNGLASLLTGYRAAAVVPTGGRAP